MTMTRPLPSAASLVHAATVSRPARTASVGAVLAAPCWADEANSGHASTALASSVQVRPVVAGTDWRIPRPLGAPPADDEYDLGSMAVRTWPVHPASQGATRKARCMPSELVAIAVIRDAADGAGPTEATVTMRPDALTSNASTRAPSAYTTTVGDAQAIRDGSRAGSSGPPMAAASSGAAETEPTIRPSASTTVIAPSAPLSARSDAPSASGGAHAKSTIGPGHVESVAP